MRKAEQERALASELQALQQQHEDKRALQKKKLEAELSAEVNALAARHKQQLEAEAEREARELPAAKHELQALAEMRCVYVCV